MATNNIEILRGEQIRTQPTEEMIDHCLSNIEKEGLADGIEWNTQISDSVVLEELVGALVQAERDSQQGLNGCGGE